MTGIDLSWNKLTGRIPPEMGELKLISALDRSHNELNGSIPTTFSGLKNIESLDLSHNKLTGAIPQQLTELTALGYFSVAYNNLSGKIPDKAQFGAFVENSYEGNSFLCGPMLKKDCNPTPEQSPAGHEEGENSFMEMLAFYLSFLVAYVTVLVVFTLYINMNWRNKWFHLVDACITTCLCKSTNQND
ncbi:receptor-like protein 2 [Durio zibethinus]|uniref:Receptor-like protein 2 n=1 Tax=Durio zibethinus TaxID=66656 RepID=A0A6P5XNH5_DURZI|nr:receptor-like protein 2 [Durio zibethinus]